MNQERFEAALELVLRRHKNDNCDISQRTYNIYRSSKNLLPQGIKLISPEEVSDILKVRYWRAIRADLLPQPLDVALFETAVNMGPGMAIRILQQALSMKPTGDFDVDTERILEIHKLEAESLTKLVLEARETKYRSLAKHKPKCAKMLDVWIDQLDSLRDALGIKDQEQAL